jgi:Tol biopolymer transport system component
MSDEQNIPPEPLDDELAEFTDNFISGQETSFEDDDEELRQLKAMVVRMQQTFGRPQPAPSLAQRIKINLVREWRAANRPANGKRTASTVNNTPWWQRLIGPLRPVGGRQMRLVYTAGLAIAILLPLAIFLLVSDGSSLTELFGTVLNNPPDSPPGYPVGNRQPVNVLLGRNERASEAGQQEGNHDSWASAVSADGRYVAFVSSADNLVANDSNGARDVFVFDRLTDGIERVSLDSAGQESNGDSLNPAISADGRYVAFESGASNLVAGDNNSAADIFIYDRQSGTTVRVSINSAGQEGQGASHGPSLSGDGRYVAFWSEATNLVDGDGNGLADVFLRDQQSGTVERISVDTAGQDGDGASRNPSLGYGGRYVAFDSQASDLVAGDGSSTSDVFVRDRETGTTVRVSVDGDGEGGNNHSYQPALSADGRFVVFHSQASNLVADDDNDAADVFFYTLANSALERVSLNNEGEEGNAASNFATVSEDGRYIAFSSYASNLADGELYNYLDVYVRDRWTGTTERASVDMAGQSPNGVSVNPALSADGRFVAFDSSASNLVEGDTNGRIDVFLRDRIPPVELTVNYNVGMPGSFFTITGTNFLRNEMITIAANGHELGTLPADDEGRFTFILATAGADAGFYFVAASVQEVQGVAVLTLDPNAEQRPAQGDDMMLNLPGGIAFTQMDYLPSVLRR